MPDQLLERILSEIRERKQAARAAYEESQRLERALAALDTDDNRGDGRERPTRRGPGTRRSGGRRRAAPGSNRDAIIAVVRDRPGITAGEIASTTGIAPATASSTVARLAGTGTLERVQLPTGRVGFRLPATTAPDTASPPVASGRQRASRRKR